MGLFSKTRKKQQVQTEQISFEGQKPVLSTTFKLEYEDVLQGLEVATANRDGKGRAIGGAVLFTVLAGMAIPFMFIKSTIAGFAFLTIAIYLLGNMIFGEKIGRRAKAKEIAAKTKEVTLTVYATGVRVNDGTRDFNIAYRIMKMYESDQSFMAMLGKTMMLSFPKRCFGADLPLVKEIFVANLGTNRRYFKVDEKGKAKA